MHTYLKYQLFFKDQTSVYFSCCITLVQVPPFKVKSVSVPFPLRGVLWSAFVPAKKSLEENSNYMTMFFFCLLYYNSKEMHKSHKI